MANTELSTWMDREQLQLFKISFKTNLCSLPQPPQPQAWCLPGAEKKTANYKNIPGFKQEHVLQIPDFDINEVYNQTSARGFGGSLVAQDASSETLSPLPSL